VVINQVAVRALGALTLERNRELTVLFAVVVGLGSAGAAHASGISPALGAFLAGMLLGGSAFATQIRADVSSLRVVLLTLFFGAAGMTADPAWIVRHLPLVLGTTAALLIGKAAVLWVVLRASGSGSRVAAATAFSLAGIGEFAFVLATIGRDTGVVSEGTRALIVSCTIVTLFATPYLVALAPLLAARLFRGAAAPIQEPTAPGPEIVVVGFGPAGRGVAQMLAGRAERTLVLDLNHESVQAAEALGLHAEIGDASQRDVLDHARVGDARLVVITIPSPELARAALEQIRRVAPHATVIVRSRHQRHVEALRTCGAHVVVGDEGEVAAALARAAAAALA
jgi:CPA2 family monovalent cation:H+ antiporter-2